jgi:methylmalonyl-CoA mutase N-terminal domain/subunit
VCSSDLEALALPTEESVRIALRTQQIVANESGVANTADPLGGSFFVESLTDLIEREATRYIEAIDGFGGMIGAIEAGYVQKEIQQAAYRAQMEIEAGKRIVVGVNKFQMSEAEPEGLLRIDRKVQDDQIRFLKQVRSKRNQVNVDKTLKALGEGARGDANLMPLILDAVKAYAGIGEICGVLREVFGEYQEQIVL